MNELDKYIEEKADDLGTLAITDGPSEEYLKEICEGYYKIKQDKKIEKLTELCRTLNNALLEANKILEDNNLPPVIKLIV